MIQKTAKSLVITGVILMIFSFLGCASTVIYDKTVPEDMMAVLSIPNFVTVTSYDGAEVNWTPGGMNFFNMKVYIPAGDHAIFIKYNDRIIPIQDNTAEHLYEFEAGIMYEFRSSGFDTDAFVYLQRSKI